LREANKTKGEVIMFNLSNFFSGISKFASIFAAAEPNPTTKAVAAAVPLAYNLAKQAHGDNSEAAKADMANSVAVAAQTADTILTGGAKESYDQYRVMAPAIFEALEEMFAPAPVAADNQAATQQG
jgi:hypothetical protein